MRSLDVLRGVANRPIFLVLIMLISVSTSAQGISEGFDQPLVEKTITFEAVNPYTNVPGNVTVTVSGTFNGKRLASGRKAGWSRIKGEQQGSFEFVPYDSSQLSFRGSFKFGLSGEIPFDRHNDILPLNFIINTTGSDGSEVTFVLAEFATVNEYGADVSFGELQLSKPVNAEAKAATP